MLASNEQPKAEDYIHQLGQQARHAARGLANATTEQKNTALTVAAEVLRRNGDALLEANARDLAAVQQVGKPESFIDRLRLTPDRVAAMAAALETIAALPDPVGRVLATINRPNGLIITRVACPLGVIGMIYESRPNVGADAGALCLKSGNAVILRCGSESLNSTRMIVACLAEGLQQAGLPAACVQLVDNTDRAAVTALLRCTAYIDLVIPRGGRSLVELVRDEARVPTLLHLDGNCHTYIHQDANLDKAVAIVRNAKMRRTGVCGATESLVIDRAVAGQFLPRLMAALPDCEVRGDATAQASDSRIIAATDADWDTEYLDAILSVKCVDGLEEALAFVAAHSSQHTDAIITENAAAAAAFQQTIDSAIVMHNASTQFADGGEFGMGAEIGIATGKMHARGPVGLEQLTSFKYLVNGQGQIRP
ncbi:MAG: glutamate-5-semialdehyde dehydrogenase [Pseudomonadales bacterium]|jgi:glutamate-5-semialdehyde dehydrogenase|nr:glutamate-5-semialdehyde dehydrogenase [Pseudomonadales bacterium]MDP4639200.1 glutamate-5-semialdehyde dehydrogenase [Pseudomonadales bacterium]MDP4764835.1 glutamate-5-semialdehyde dehydrogenase [Pseudomonadales bacterium]MDP4874956.1 glutamate-5-semialdehyde dehydrogenase [Pseudomonadales bacterium]MDP4910672.1 glutamate-5-semialdehyde dehydrogenase [Pseudomonadales bacterium]